MNRLLLLLLISTSSLLEAVQSDPVWDRAYSDNHFTTDEKVITCREHHSQQNSQITNDFLAQISQSSDSAKEAFYRALCNASTILEVGCGTGEMVQELAEVFHPASIIGVDISATAIAYATVKNRSVEASYYQLDCLEKDIGTTLGHFDLSICSNCLEHFKNPYPLIDNMIASSNLCLFLVPYKQPVTDGYDKEGGEGHVFTFDENCFEQYELISWFTFKTGGWQYSSQGETPLQLALLVRKK